MSRRRRTAFIVSAVLLAAAIILLDHNRHKTRLNRPTAVKTTSSDLAKYHQKTFTVINVVDGDTFDIDIGDGKYDKTRIRLWGVDTPETKSEKYGVMYFGPQATEFTTKLTLGKQVAVYLSEERTRGKYGRLLAYVKLPDGRFLNEVLIEDGFGYADLRFKHSFYNKYQQLGASAKRNKKGLWKNVTRDQLPEWLKNSK